MRRFQTLLLGMGLAAAPVGAVAGPADTTPKKSDAAVTASDHRPMLGVMVLELTPELRKHYGAGNDRGLLVGRVEPSSAAARAGLQVGDVITEVRGSAVDEARDIVSALASTRPGDKVSVIVLRGTKPLTLTATMQDTAMSSTFSLPSWIRGLLPPRDTNTST